MAELVSTTWELGRDRFGRRITLTKEGHDFSIKIDPSNQRDEGELIRSLNAQALIDAGDIAKSVRRS